MRFLPIMRSRIWLFALFGLHLALAFYYFPVNLFVQQAPIHRADYATHFYDAYAVSELLETGHSWGYDPYFMAGYPVGTVFDVDNKLTQVFVFAFRFIGKPQAYNLSVWVLFVALPFFTYWSSRNFRQNARARTLAVALALGVWYLDPTVATMRHVGMYTFAAAAFLALWVVSLFAVYQRRRSVRSWLLLTLALTLILWLHPLTFFILLVPMGVLYLSNFRRWGWQGHLWLIGTVLLVLLVNAYWLLPLVQFYSILTNTGVYFAGGVDALWNDLFQAGLAEGSQFPRNLVVRWFIFALSLIGLVSWRRAQEGERALLIGSGVVWCAGLAYLAAYFPGGLAIEPYRFIAAALFFAVVPAAAALENPAFWQPLPQLPNPIKFGLAALGFIVALGVLNAAYELHPRIERAWMRVGLEDRMIGPTDRQGALLKWIKTNTNSDGRILIQDWWTGALIPYFTGREVIGGPYYPYFIQHAYANTGGETAFGERISEISAGDLQKYLRTYNVQWVIVNPGMLVRPDLSLGRYADSTPSSLLALAATVGEFRIYKVSLNPNFILKGEGQVAATYNTIRVTAASPGSIVLKYHWLDTLKSEPPLELAPYPVLDDPVGFIQVNNGAVQDFVIYNGY